MNVQEIITNEEKVIPSLRAKFFQTVTVESSHGSYGKWVVKYSPIHFRFFWRKAEADQFTNEWNRQPQEEGL